MVDYDYGSQARDLVSNQESTRATRDQIAENSARQAFFAVEHQISGVGYMAMTRPIMFDCTFTQKPVFTWGIALERMPDVTHYRYPLANAGVYKWVTEPTPEARARQKRVLLDVAATSTAGSGYGGEAVSSLDNSSVYAEDELLYKGAYLYFNLQIDTVQRPRTDGSNLTLLQAQLAQVTPGTYDYEALQANIKEAQEALYLNAHPPTASVTFSLLWMGVALKGLPANVQDKLHADPAATPLQAGGALGTSVGTT